MPRIPQALVALFLAHSLCAQEFVPGIAMEIELGATDPVLDRHGPARTFEYEVTFDGSLCIWASSSDFDPILRVTNADGDLLAEDDDSGGGTTAYLAMNVVRDGRMRIIVAASRAETSGALRMHVYEGPETEATRAAASGARDALAEITRLRQTNDLDEARLSIEALVEELSSTEGAERSALVADVTWLAGIEAQRLALPRTAERARRLALAHCRKKLPDDHAALQSARHALAWTLNSLGQLSEAHELQEKVLEVRSRTLPDDHADLQWARENLSLTLRDLGDLERALALQKKVVEIRTLTLDPDHAELQVSRNNLAVTLSRLGDLAGALALQQQVLEVYSRTLPEDHSDLQWVRTDLAGTLMELGELDRARALQEQVLAIRQRTRPDDHPDTQAARANLALTLREQGDLERARALQQKVLEVHLRTRSEEDLDLQTSRSNLAWTLYSLGDLEGARTLQERVLEVRARALPDDHPHLQTARHNLALTIADLGDLSGARVLQEKVLEVRARTLLEEHPGLQRARGNLARTLYLIGDLERARELQEMVLDVYTRTRPADDAHIQEARTSLALTVRLLGDLERARTLQEQVLEVNGRVLPAEHRDVQWAHWNLVETLVLLEGRRSEAGPVEARVLAEPSARCVALGTALCRSLVRAAHSTLHTGSIREAEERCARLAQMLDLVLSLAGGFGVYEPSAELERESFVLCETTRGASLSAATLLRSAADSPDYTRLRTALQAKGAELAALVRAGTTSDAYRRALAEREQAERALVELARELGRIAPASIAFDVDALARGLEDGTAVISFRRYKRWRVVSSGELDARGLPRMRGKAVESLSAMVLAHALEEADTGGARPTLARVELGPIAPIEEAVHAWRESLGVGQGSRGVPASPARASVGDDEARATRLRELIFDPLLESLQGARHLIVVADDVLHLVPLDALPLGDGARIASGEPALVGDRWRIESRLTLTELLGPASSRPDAETFVAVGGADYGPVTGGKAARREDETGILRSEGSSGGFRSLPGAELEADGLARLFREQVAALPGGAASVQEPVQLLTQAAATREALFDRAPRARWLHVATHGWFAPESVRSWGDAAPLDEGSGFAGRRSGLDVVRGSSPMLLCGIALAGANLPPDSQGRARGLLTAEELATLDLSGCSLAVLSACDTNVGERRAGQGIASLQKALHMAGASTVITSLWKVPDEATTVLMLDLYRRIWAEGQPESQALWEAKLELRRARDGSGRPKYSTRDWAAWVLTGEPDQE